MAAPMRDGLLDANRRDRFLNGAQIGEGQYYSALMRFGGQRTKSFRPNRPRRGRAGRVIMKTIG